jgi:predicted membrane channel-forming protein YqfA (hemolysin III family)
MNLQTNSTIDYYHLRKEKVNIISHAIGLIAGIFEFVLRMKKDLASADLLYCVCLITPFRCIEKPFWMTFRNYSPK